MTEWFQEHGGLAGIGSLGALGILVIFSLVSILVMIERAMTLRAVSRQEDRDYNHLRKALRERRREDVLLCAQAGASPVAAAIQAGIGASDLGESEMSDAIDQEVSMQGALLGRNLPVLATVASVAPYIGLFGTVLGILGAFGKIAATGQTGAKVVAGPIAEALTATAFGLGVAIPAVIAYNYFSGRVNALGLQVEDHALELSARLPQVVMTPQEESHENQ
jgi:biopolymer transport protein ExbB/TolQ